MASPTIPLQVRTSSERTVDHPRRTSEDDVIDHGHEAEERTSIDVSSIAGLITILTVNLHQLESLFQVGPDLGPKFWINLVLIIISLCSVYPLIAIRKVQSETKRPSATNPRRGRCLNRTSLVLTVILFTVNLTLQIINDINASCVALTNSQPLPPVPRV